MEIKKYRAKSIRDAVCKVRDVLGPDAMIVSTKRLKDRGHSHGFEVVAAAPNQGKMSGQSNPSRISPEQPITIKEMLFLLNRFDGVMTEVLGYPSILGLYARLIRNGVNEPYVRLFLERAGVFDGPLDQSKEGINKKTIKEILKTLAIGRPFRKGNGNRIVAAFVGTTGVGKTTTTAKIAAQLMIKNKKKVGLISIDNYRIGGMDQLKTFANILGIPCFPAFAKKDIQFALQRLEGTDVVLVDTAGQSQYDTSRLNELQGMLSGEFDISTHLLLSLPTSAREMASAGRKFSGLNLGSYIFTKADETEIYGSIVNQIMTQHMPVSYVTIGQNVPEDIEIATKEKLIQRIFNKN